MGRKTTNRQRWDCDGHNNQCCLKVKKHGSLQHRQCHLYVRQTIQSHEHGDNHSHQRHVVDDSSENPAVEATVRILRQSIFHHCMNADCGFSCNPKPGETFARANTEENGRPCQVDGDTEMYECTPTVAPNEFSVLKPMDEIILALDDNAPSNECQRVSRRSPASKSTGVNEVPWRGSQDDKAKQNSNRGLLAEKAEKRAREQSKRLVLEIARLRRVLGKERLARERLEV